MPESSRICGEPIAPALTMISDAGRNRVFLAAGHVTDRVGAAAFDFNPSDRGLADQLEIRARQRRMKERDRRAAAKPIATGHVIGARTLLVRAVEIVQQRNAAALGDRVLKRLRDQTDATLPRHLERPAAAVVVAGAVLVILGLLEIREHVVVAPARVAEVAPVVVILAVAAHVEHAVHGAAAADDAAAGPGHLPPVHVSLRRGFVAPIAALLELRHLVHQRQHARPAVEHGLVATARFEQEHADVRVLTEPGGDDAAGRPSADHHVVVAVRAHRRNAPRSSKAVVDIE